MGAEGVFARDPLADFLPALLPGLLFGLFGFSSSPLTGGVTAVFTAVPTSA